MQDIRIVSVTVFVASFLIGFLIFEADKARDGSIGQNLQLSMTPLFSADKSVK